MNEQNLIPNSERTPKELREMTRKGGIASGKARREKKRIAKVLEIVMQKASKDERYADFLEEIVNKAFIRELEKPNFDTLKKMQDILGESVQKIEMTETTPPEDKLKKMIKDAGL